MDVVAAGKVEKVSTGKEEVSAQSKFKDFAYTTSDAGVGGDGVEAEPLDLGFQAPVLQAVLNSIRLDWAYSMVLLGGSKKLNHSLSRDEDRETLDHLLAIQAAHQLAVPVYGE